MRVLIYTFLLLMLFSSCKKEPVEQQVSGENTKSEMTQTAKNQSENNTEKSKAPINQKVNTSGDGDKAILPVVHVESINFGQKSIHNTNFDGMVLGRDKWLWNLDVKKGQTMNIKISADNKNTVLYAISPVGKNLKQENAVPGTPFEFTHKAEKRGNYVFQIRLTPNAGHAGEMCNYNFDVKLTD